MLRQIAPSLIVILSLFVFLFIYTKIAGPIPFSVNSVTTSKSDTFYVSGEGRAAVKPDIAVVSIGIQANGATVREAQDRINTVINRVSSAVKELGTSENDIRTTNYNISPNYDFREETQRIIGYNSNTNLSIKIRDIDKVNSVIDAATVNGANQVGGVTFEIDDRSKAENEAREKAVAEAKKKAEDASRIAGFRLGRIINYLENFDRGPIPVPLREGALEVAQDASTKIEPGISEVVVNVTLSYEII